MKFQLALTAAAACAIAACTGDGISFQSLPPPRGWGSATPPPRGSGPTRGGPEPGLTGADPAPGTGGGNTIAGLCAQVCGKLASACGGQTDPATCPGECAADVMAAGACQSLYVAFLQCIATAQLTCSGTEIQLPPDCYDEILALAACESSTAMPTPTTGPAPATAN